MDCSAFRRHHLAYVDDTLPGDLVVAAARHVAECPACARHDTAVRRSLLLARNLAPVRCSDDFAARLEARLAVVRLEQRTHQRAEHEGTVALDDWAPSWWELASARLRTRPAVAAAAALVALTVGTTLQGERDVTSAGVGAAATAMASFGSPFSPPPAPLAVAVEEPMFQPDGGEAVTWVVYDDGSGAHAIDASALVVPAATGAPVWAAAMLAGEVPAALWRGTGARAARRGAMSPRVHLVGDVHDAR